MNSINTNFSAITALKSLNATNEALAQTQNRIATGYRVSSAEDNAAYWSMATTLRSDNQSLSAVSDALGLGAATIDVAYTAMDSAIDVASEMKAKLVAAREPGVDRAKVQGEIDELQNQLRSIASSATFSGENWLSVDSSAANYSATESVVAAFNRGTNANGSTAGVTTLSVDVSATALFNADAAATADARGILGSNRMTISASDTATAQRGSIAVAGTIVVASADGTGEIDISTATDAEIDDYVQAVDAAITEMTSAATDLGSSKKRIDLQKDFVSALMDSIDRGISSLVDADMSAESTKLQALQTQQQLGIQALSIANSQSQNVLALFR